MMNKLDLLLAKSTQIQNDIAHIKQKQDALAAKIEKLQINDKNAKVNEDSEVKLYTIIDFANNYDLTLPLTNRETFQSFEQKLQNPQCFKDYVSF